MTQPTITDTDPQLIADHNWKMFLSVIGQPSALVNIQGEILYSNTLFDHESNTDYFRQIISSDTEIRDMLAQASSSSKILSVPTRGEKTLKLTATPLSDSQTCIVTLQDDVPEVKGEDMQGAEPSMQVSVLHFGIISGEIAGLEHANTSGQELFDNNESQIIALVRELIMSFSQRGSLRREIIMHTAKGKNARFDAEYTLLGNSENGFVCVCLTAHVDAVSVQLQKVIDNSSAAFFVADSNGTIIYANKALLANSTDNKSIAALPNLKAIPSSVLGSESDASLWPTVSSGLPWEGELTFLLNIEQEFWRLFSVSPASACAQSSYYIGAEHTSGELYSTLNKMQMHYSLLDTVLDAIPQPFTVYGTSHFDVLHANTAARNFSGKLKCRIDQTLVKPFCKACRGTAVNQCLLEECYKTKATVTDTFEVEEDGEIKYFTLMIYPVLENDEVTAVIEVANEITELRAQSTAPDKPRENVHEVSMQKTLLQSVIDSIPEHIFYKDASGSYLGSNSAFLSLAGVDAIEGKKDFDFFPKEIAYYFSLQDQLVFKKGVPARSERWVQFPSGDRVLLNTLRVPFRFQDKTVGVIGISRDITDIKRIETEMLEQKERIEVHNMEIAAQRDELQLQRDHVYRQNKEITQSINYALRIQNAVLPQREDIDKVLCDYFIYFKPRNIVSGDFYWFARKGDVSLIAAADCTGHGVPGALMSILGVAFLKQIVSGMDTLDTGEILNQLRKNIIMSLHQTGKDGETTDGLDIALYTIDHASMELNFSGAYNPLYLVRGDTLVEYKGDKMPISLHATKSGFSTATIQLQKNDAVYIFSDGFADQFGGTGGKKLKKSGFKSLVQAYSSAPMAQQQNMFSKFFDSWTGALEQVDDILIIGARF